MVHHCDAIRQIQGLVQVMGHIDNTHAQSVFESQE